uniref:Interferon-induced protein with tetratricopeptide repeats 5 n=1 Tax=Amphilophus citrinellus TaxID=61819 RepID=A0A3Q0SCB4_AMPCI
MSSSALLSRLQQLQCHFTWDLKKESVDLEDLSTRLQNDIQLQLGKPGAVAHSYNFLAYVRYSFSKEALSHLNQSEETITERYADESERRLIVTYGDMAWLKYHTGDYTHFLLFLQLKYTTGSSTSLLPEVYGEKAWTYLKFSRSSLSKAIDCFRKALEVQTHDSEWNAGYAIALFRTELVKNLEEGEESPAIKQLRFALEVNPDDAVLQAMLAVKLVVYKKFHEAKDLVKKALETDPDNPHVIRYIGKYFRMLDQLDESIDMLERALKRADQSPFIHHQLALCYKRKKIAEQSRKPFRAVRYWRRICIRHLEEAVKIRPSFVLASTDLALLYAEERDIRRAENIFLQCLQKFPEFEESLCQTFHQRYADFHLYHKKNEVEAIAHYTKVSFRRLKQIAERRLSKNRGDGEAHALLGQVAKAEGNKKKAAEFYEKALDCDVDNAEYLSALCELRMELQ